MLGNLHTAKRLGRLAPLACALWAGCAGLRCPRIDPTGERCLIWPKDQAATPVAPVAAATNPIAPPVLTDPVFPAPAAAPVAPATAAAPAVVPASAAYGPAVGDRLTIAPGRVLAPVGSEVVLKASICTTEGYTLADQRVEWMLARNGVGQFVEVGGKGVFHPPLAPWFAGAKVDNYLANGYTASGPLCISRGTADPSDDININRGDAWVSVTSPSEGTSYVTAYTPDVENWDLRKASTTVYWVDVQWTFPPATVASAGRGETLTTVVNRQTDGTPLEGWIVRYQVEGGQPQDVTTGSDGRASVQVTPTAAGADSSRIDLQLIRPANFGQSEAPRLVVGSGTTIVTWGGGTYLPPSSAQPMPTSPALVTPGAEAPIQSGPPTPQPQLPSSPASRARLELNVQGPPQAQVGRAARFDVTLRNVGDAPATGVVLSSQFDPGLVFSLVPTKQRIENPSIGTIAPGDARTVSIELQVNKAGQLCQEVSVSYAEGSPVTQRVCVTAVEAPPQREPGLKVNIDGPLQKVEGETATFRITVRNTGQTPLLDVVTVEEYQPGVLQPTDRNLQVVSGTVTERIARLEVGASRQYDRECLCRQATRVGVLVKGSAVTDPPSRRVETADEHFVEILPRQNHPPAGAGAAPPTSTAGPLSVRLAFVNPPLRVGGRFTAQVTVANTSATESQQQVRLRVIVPPQLTPDKSAIELPPGVQVELQNDEVIFTPLASLAPREQALYRIPFNARDAGSVEVTAQAVSSGAPLGVVHREAVDILANRF